MDPKDLEALGHISPIYQVIGGLIIVLTGLLTVGKAAMDLWKKTPATPPTSRAAAAASQADEREFAKMEQQLLRNELELVVRTSRDSLFVAIYQVRDALMESQKADRHELKNMMQSMVKKFEEEFKELETRVRNLEIMRGPRRQSD